jgi:hypothetical protein
MTRILRLAWVCAALILLGSAGYCVDVYPTVNFAFNAATYEYSWTVNYTADVNVYFTTFLVYSKLPALSWTSATGAWSGSPAVDEAWTFNYADNGDGTMALQWLGGSEHQRKPSGGAWTGVFKVVVPNSAPVAGNVRTYASVIKYQSQSSYVPELVPEPSGLMVLGSLAGLVPLVLRRRRQ